MRAVLPALAAFLLAGCFSAASGPPAAAPMGRIDGAVVDGLLNPYPYQNVTLVNLGLTDQTSKLGGFTFRDVPPGTYTLVTQKPGTDGDVRVVEVRAGQTTRVILQMLLHREPLPFVESLKNTAHSDLAQPESICHCTWTPWSRFVLDEPKEIVLQAQWDTLPAGGNGLTLQLVDAAGKVLGSGSGGSPCPDDATRLCLEVAVHDALPSEQKIALVVHFGDDFTPRPFDMPFVLDFYYGADREHQGSPR